MDNPRKTKENLEKSKKHQGKPDKIWENPWNTDGKSKKNYGKPRKIPERPGKTMENLCISLKKMLKHAEKNIGNIDEQISICFTSDKWGPLLTNKTSNKSMGLFFSMWFAQTARIWPIFVHCLIYSRNIYGKLWLWKFRIKSMESPIRGVWGAAAPPTPPPRSSFEGLRPSSSPGNRYLLTLVDPGSTRWFSGIRKPSAFQTITLPKLDEKAKGN